MPTILQILGWRLFFYANEGNEPIHIHAVKGEIECKFWIKQEEYEIELAYEYNLKAVSNNCFAPKLSAINLGKELSCRTIGII